MREKFIVTASPHIGTNLTTRMTMLIVVIALIPAVIASFLAYGILAPLSVIVISIISAVATETIFNLIYHKENTVGDCSAIVTGLILALNLPPNIPLYIPVIGSIFAIFLVKMIFGGIGKNFANPACTARVFLLLSFSSAMTTFTAPVSYTSGFWSQFFSWSNISSATPLESIKDTALNGLPSNVNLGDLFLGNIAGSLGEISTIALLIGGLILIFTKVINYKIPLMFFVSVSIFTLIMYPHGYTYILPMLFSGGIALGGFFMLTDYASSPITAKANVIYAIGAGFLTVLLRRYGGFPEGVSFAILIMNVIAPLLDKYMIPKPFGFIKEKKKKETV